MEARAEEEEAALGPLLGDRARLRALLEDWLLIDDAPATLDEQVAQARAAARRRRLVREMGAAVAAYVAAHPELRAAADAIRAADAPPLVLDRGRAVLRLGPPRVLGPDEHAAYTALVHGLRTAECVANWRAGAASADAVAGALVASAQYLTADGRLPV